MQLNSLKYPQNLLSRVALLILLLFNPHNEVRATNKKYELLNRMVKFAKMGINYLNHHLYL